MLRFTSSSPFLAGVALVTFAMVSASEAGPLKSADITQIYKKVTVSEPGGAPQQANVNQRVGGQAMVATGAGSRAELKFSDSTVTRLGANTVFSFTQGTRDMTLDKGTMLLRVPKNAGGAKITTAAVSAAITGTTVLVEANPPEAQGAAGDDLGFTKWIVLEGEMRVYVNDRLGESRLISPGQMVILPPSARAIPMPVDIDLSRLIATSNLVTKGPEKLESTDLIVESVEKQEEEIKDGGLVPTNLIILGKGNELVLASDGLLSQINNAQSALSIEAIEKLLEGETPEGFPIDASEITIVELEEPGQDLDKYGDLVTISDPTPFPIDDSTVIITDPTIETPNYETGVKQGTVYNTQIQGLASRFFFSGSRRDYDDTLDVIAALSGDIGVFRFEELQIFGNPEVITANGPDSLALISEGDLNYGSGYDEGSEALSSLSIEYGGDGSNPLDFSGLNTVMLITEDGDVNLYDNGGPIKGPKGTLYISARGDESELYVETGIVSQGNNSQVILQSEGDVNLNNYYDAIKSPSLSLLAGKKLTLNGLLDLTKTDRFIVRTGQVDLQQTLAIDSDANAQFIVTDGGIDSYGAGLEGFDLIATAEGIDITGADVSSDTIVSGGSIKVNDGKLSQATKKNVKESDRIGTWDAEGEISADEIDAANVSIAAHRVEGGEGGGEFSDEIIGEQVLAVSGGLDGEFDYGYAELSEVSGTYGIEAYEIFADRIVSDYGSITTYGDMVALGGADSMAILFGLGTIYAQGDIISKMGDILSFQGDIYSAYGEIIAQNGSILADYGINAGSSIIASQDIENYVYGGITAYGDIIAQNGRIYEANGDVTADGGNVEAGTDIIARNGTAKATSGEESGGGDIRAGRSIEAEDLEADGDIVATSGDIIVKAGEPDGGESPFSTFSQTEESFDGDEEPQTGGTILIGGSKLSAGNRIQADEIIYTAYEDTLDITADTLEVGDLVSENGGTFNVSAREVVFSPTSDMPAEGITFSTDLDKLTLNGESTLTIASDLGTASKAVSEVNVAETGGLITDNAEGHSIFADEISGFGTISASIIEAERLSIAALEAESLTVGKLGITRRNDGPSIASITLTGEAPSITSLGGIRYSHTASDNAAGKFTLTSTGSFDFSPTGINGAKFNGAAKADGHAGEFYATSDAQITLDNTSLNANAVHKQANGGTISLQSNQVGGTGIRITHSGQIRALMAAGAVGPGGRILVRADMSGIDIDGTLDAGSTSNEQGSLIQIIQNAGDSSTPIDIRQNANLVADIVSVQALGPNGTVNIHAGASGPNLSAHQQLQLFGGSANGAVNFLGSGVVNLNSPDILVRANAVNVGNAVRVNNNGATTVGANQHNYINGVGASGYGGFRNAVTQQTLSGR